MKISIFLIVVACSAACAMPASVVKRRRPPAGGRRCSGEVRAVVPHTPRSVDWEMGEMQLGFGLLLGVPCVQTGAA